MESWCASVGKVDDILTPVMRGVASFSLRFLASANLGVAEPPSDAVRAQVRKATAHEGGLALPKTLVIAWLVLLTALMAACSSSDKAGIVLNVTTASGVDRSAILSLQVTVDGRAQSYDVGAAAPWSLGIKTSAGSKSITVSGMTASAVIAQWQGTVEAAAGRVVTHDVVLQAIGATPLDGGGGPASDGAIGDGSLGSGGSVGRDGGIANGGGGRPGMGGASGFGGAAGGLSGSGAVPGTGGLPGLGGRRTSGAPGTGGGVAGTPGAGGLTASGGRTGAGGTSIGGRTGTGGITMSGGIQATGGALAFGGSGGATPGCTVDPPLSGGTSHCTSIATGKVDGYTWTIWSSGDGGCLTTYSDAGCAFSANWNDSGDFLARCGLQWDASKTYEQLGTISAEFAETHGGSASGVSYIGVYGWTMDPCIEFYIVEDSFDAMPLNLGSTTNKGTVDIDGGTYVLYVRTVSGLGTVCGLSSFKQYYSVRTTARACGTISVSKHFAAWAAANMPLGKLYDATLFVEADGGAGNVDFTKATMVVSGGPP